MSKYLSFGCGVLAGVTVSLLIDLTLKKKNPQEEETAEECFEKAGKEAERDFASSVKLQNIKNKENVLVYLARIREERYAMENHSDEELPDDQEEEPVDDGYEFEDTSTEGSLVDDSDEEDEDDDDPDEGGDEEMKHGKVNAGIPPKVISPEEFGEMDGYDVESLIYFSDGFLTDTDYRLIKDVEDLVGSDSLKRFGEFEIDSVFVRNENYETDYEILLDLRKYEAVSKRAPKPHEE